MLNTIHSRFGGVSARWLAVPAVLGLVGVAVVSLAIGAGAVGGPSPAVANACAAKVHATPCRDAARQVTANLAPSKPVGALPRLAQPMATSPVSADARARVATLRAQLHASMPGLAAIAGS